MKLNYIFSGIAILACTTFASAQNGKPAPQVAQPAKQNIPLMQINACIINDNKIMTVKADYDIVNGDTFLTQNGKKVKFGKVYPTGNQYLMMHRWSNNTDPIIINGKKYVKQDGMDVFGNNEATLYGVYDGVPFFKKLKGSPDVIFGPIQSGCEFQPYKLAQ